MRIDIERMLDEATVDEWVHVEGGRMSMEGLRRFFGRFVVGENGEALSQEEGMRVVGKLTLREFQELRKEGELRNAALPLESESA